MLHTTEGGHDYGGFKRFNRTDTKITVIPTTAYIFFLEEVLVLGSQVNQITQEVKEFRFAKGKSALIVVLKLYHETENTMVSKDISVSHVEKPLLTSLTLQLTRARKH